MSKLFGKLGSELMEAITGKTAGKRAPKPDVTPEAVETEEALGGLSGTPVDPATGHEPRNTMEYTEDSIEELGAGNYEAPGELRGRDGRDRNLNVDFYEDPLTKETMEWYSRANDGYLSNEKRRVVTHDETIGKAGEGLETSPPR